MSVDRRLWAGMVDQAIDVVMTTEVCAVLYYTRSGQWLGLLRHWKATKALSQSFWLQNPKVCLLLATSHAHQCCLVLLAVWSRSSAAEQQGTETSLDEQVVHRDTNVFLQQSPVSYYRFIHHGECYDRGKCECTGEGNTDLCRLFLTLIHTAVCMTSVS